MPIYRITLTKTLPSGEEHLEELLITAKNPKESFNNIPKDKLHNTKYANITASCDEKEIKPIYRVNNY